MLNFTPFTGTKKEGGAMDVSFWLSFSPMAPLFGVKYRYADMFKFDPTFAKKAAEAKPVVKKAEPKAAPKPKAKKAEAPKVAEAPVATPKVEKPEVVEVKVEEAPAPIVETVVEAAAPVVETVVETLFETPAEAPVADRPATLFDAPPANVDDLKLIKGVGPKLEGMLNGLGIYTFEQIAGFSVSELQWVDDNLTSFKGRAFRDDWIAQAKELLAQ